MLRHDRPKWKNSCSGSIKVISFIIPAHNEERLIGRTLNALEDCGARSGPFF